MRADCGVRCECPFYVQRGRPSCGVIARPEEAVRGAIDAKRSEIKSAVPSRAYLKPAAAAAIGERIQDACARLPWPCRLSLDRGPMRCRRDSPAGCVRP